MREELRDECVEIEARVTIERKGHVEPIPHSQFVKLIYAHTNLCLHPTMEGYEIANEPTSIVPEIADVRMNEAGVGFVVKHCWHVSPTEMCTNAELDRVMHQNKAMPHIRNVYQHLWYLIQFKTGRVWVRYNWLEELT